MSFHIHVTYCGTSVRSVVEKTKSSKKERRLKIWTHANLLQRKWNANCNTSDQGVISHNRTNKKTNFCILIKLKATFSIIVWVVGKMMFILNSMANFFLAALLCSLFVCFVCFFKLQSDFTDAGRRQIHLSCHDNDMLLKKPISRISNFSEFFLTQLASLVIISFPKDQNDKWTRA